MKRILQTFFMFLALVGMADAAEWMQFTLIERPYYDGAGNILDSIEGRRNRPGIDEFSGGGKIYPDAARSEKVLEWHEKGTTMLLKVDISPEDAASLTTKQEDLTFQASPKILRAYKYQDHAPQVILDKDAETLKVDVFGIIPIASESGVTP